MASKKASKGAVSTANKKKAEAGKSFDKKILLLLKALKQDAVIQSYEWKKNFLEDGYEYESAYLADLCILSNDDSYIIVRSTTSYRQDRCKIPFYDLQGIKNNSTIKGKIIASVFVVEKHDTQFDNFRQRVKDGKQFCPASHIINFSELKDFLEGFRNQFIQEQQLLSEEQKNLNHNTQNRGSFFGKKGNKIEGLLVKLLSDKAELKKFKSDKSDDTYKLIIDKIIKDKVINKLDIYKIEATNKIPPLKSGGKPKTDILLKILTPEQTVLTTISCKSSTTSKVSCHDYTATAFNKVLKVSGKRLGKYINLFQKHGTFDRMKSNFPSGFTLAEFASLLKEYEQVLLEWSLTGMHDDDNLVNKEQQISNYIYMNLKGVYAFYKTSEYIDTLKLNPKGKLKTPLSWTYPSKQLGKRIQLKVPLMLDN